MYEDGRSDNHTSEINKTPESKVNTPDLIRKSGDETTENTPSQNENDKESVTLESSNVADDKADEGYESRKNTHSYIEILPDETEASDGGNADEDEYAYATTNNKTRTHDKAEGQINNDYDDTTLSRKDQGKDSTRRYSRHVKSESDYETVRSSQLQSSVIDDDDDFDSDFDDISESNYAHLHEFLDEVEYWNGEWAKSFQALQRMFHPKTKVWNP